MSRGSRALTPLKAKAARAPPSAAIEPASRPPTGETPSNARKKTLITRPRWTSVEADGERRDICMQCRETEPDWGRRIHEAEAAPESGGRTGLLGALTRG